MELKFSYSMINISGCDFILRDGKRLSRLSFAYYINTLERKTRLELATTSLENWNSTIELLPQVFIDPVLDRLCLDLNVQEPKMARSGYDSIAWCGL